MRGRMVRQLSGLWGFQPDPERMGQEANWQVQGPNSPREIQVPHTWNVEEDLQEYRGLCWYSYCLQAPKEWEGRRVRIRFEAVYRDAVVWLNGQRIGSHGHSGYTVFELDLTAAIRYGEDNLLVLSVDNANSEQALPFTNSFDWADDGGIIRGVSLLVTGEPAIDYVTVDAIPKFEEEADGRLPGEVSMNVVLCAPIHELRQPAMEQRLAVEVAIFRSGDCLWSGTYEFPYRTADRLPISGIRLDSVDLWHFDRPHLYEVNVKVKHNGELSDEVSTSVGFREIRTSGHQLLLNREPVRLMGVEWMPGSRPDVGMAESLADQIRSLEQLKDVNCVFTRFHWQQDDQLLDWCDRNGILVQEEIPHWQKPMEPDKAFMPISGQHALEMIHRHYNHPCIFAWGMGNELNGQSSQTSDYMKELKAYMQSLDAGRIINYVSNTFHENPARDTASVGDLLMWNDYIGTWQQGFDNREVIEDIFRTYPDKPFVISEYGLCEPNFSGGDPGRIEILREKTELYRQYPGFAGLIFFSLNDYRTQRGEFGSGRMRQRVHGVTNLYGDKNPSYEVLREISSPVLLDDVRRTSEDSLVCTLRVRSDIPSYTVSGYHLHVRQMDGGRTEKIMSMPDLAPGESAEFIVTDLVAASLRLTIAVVRPTGFSVLEQTIQL